MLGSLNWLLSQYFGFVVLDLRAGFLNGGFGKAYVLTPDDLTVQDAAGPPA